LIGHAPTLAQVEFSAAYTVDELAEDRAVEPEDRAVRILGVANQDRPGLRRHLNASAARTAGAFSPLGLLIVSVHGSSKIIDNADAALRRHET
jgi:hypothetical protein